MSNKDFQLIRLDFEDVRPRELREDKRRGYVAYGKRNEYPDYLLDLANQSAKHNAIIRGKVDFIIGNGFTIETPQIDQKTNQPKQYSFLEAANAEGETLNDVFRKAIFDVETFGGAYVELISAKGGKVAEVNHLDYTKCRVSKDLSTLYYSKEGWAEKTSSGDWTEKQRVKFDEIPAFTPKNTPSRCFIFIREYTPGMETYPLPGYVGALRYIAVDIAISEYHLNGITNGMFASKMISFNNGVPEEDEKKEIEKRVNDKFAGQKNAGKIMINFSRSGDNQPTVIDLSGTELGDHFDLLNKTVQQEVFSGHRITSPMLFGIKTEGQLGGRAEIREAYELFNATYLENKREIIEKYANLICERAGVPKVKLQRSEPIAHEFDAATIADNMTEDEIRDKMGLAPRDEASGLRGQSKIVKRLAALSPLVANKVLDMLSPNEVRSIIGLPALPGGDNVEGQTDPAAVPTPPTAQISQSKADDLDDDADAAVFAEFGIDRDAVTVYESRKIMYEDSLKAANAYFAEVKDLKGNKLAVLELLEKDPKIDAKAISEALDITEGRASAILEDLTKAKLLKVKTEKVGEDEVTSRTPNKDARDIINKNGDGTTSIKVLYSYEGPKDDRNRPFCAKILELNKLYSRQDIEAISERVGYSVWDRRGGWYKPAGASEARPYCRHSWFANVVIDKTK